MIRLNLQGHAASVAIASPLPRDGVDAIEADFERLIAEVRRLLQQARATTVYISVDTLLQARDALMPAERMGVLGAVRVGPRTILGSMRDVTGRSSRIHVRADAAKLHRALLSYEQAGCPLAGWIHSHPGQGPGATAPSQIDRAQYADWSRDFGDHLVGLIAVEDGHVRVWGDAIESGRLRVEFLGTGIKRVEGVHHVYKLVS